MKKTIVAALLASWAPASAGSFHIGLGSAVASAGAKVVNKAYNPIPSCGGNFTLFTQAPVSDPSLVSLSPIGHTFPPGHTFPSDHLYFNYNESTTAMLGTQLYAPSDGWITSVERSDYTSGSPNSFGVDYQIGFSPCAEVVLLIGHVDFIPAFMANPAGNTSTQCSAFGEGSSPGSEQGTSCTTNMQVAVKAGTIIGTGNVGDFGPLIDTRIQLSGFVDPAAHNLNRGFCPLNYFADSVKTSYTALLGGNVGSTFIPRTIAPVCGTTVQDAAGTAQGDWFAPGGAEWGLNNLALVHNNVSPSTATISSGDLIPGLIGTSVDVLPKTTADGTRINYDFNLVNDGQIYCYDSFRADLNNGAGGSTLQGDIFLIQLSGSSFDTLKAELQSPGTSCAAVGAPSWTFTGSAVTFNR